MIGQRRSVSFLVLALAAVSAGTLGKKPQAPGPVVATVVPYKPSGIYAFGEKAGWTVTGPAGTYHYVLKRNNQSPIASGDLDLATGEKRIETVSSEPEMLYLELTPPSGGRPATYGAAVEPRKLKPVVARPDDFDAFWKGKLAALRAIPAGPVLTPGESYKPDVEYATIAMAGPNGTHVYGQIARPKRPGKYPAIAVFQWASPPYPLQKSWVIEPASRGFVVLNIEPHDVLPTEPPAYYQGLPNELKNYASIGRDDRERSYFVDMALRDVRAVDYLAGLPDWDGKTLAVMGTSMGGQQSFYAAGLCPKVTHLLVDVPAGADLAAGLHGRQEGYPNFPTNEPKTMETARYVDTVNFAPRIKATCLVAMGFKDNVAPPAGIWTAFNLIKGPKEAAPMMDSPHNNYATPEQQRPWNERSAAWLDELAKTGKVEVRKDAGLP